MLLPIFRGYGQYAPRPVYSRLTCDFRVVVGRARGPRGRNSGESNLIKYSCTPNETINRYRQLFRTDFRFRWKKRRNNALALSLRAYQTSQDLTPPSCTCTYSDRIENQNINITFSHRCSVRIPWYGFRSFAPAFGWRHFSNSSPNGSAIVRRPSDPVELFLSDRIHPHARSVRARR